MPTNRITKYTFNGNLDFSSKIMSLDTAKWILSHLSAVNGKTIQFSTELWSLIEDDEEAIELLEEAYSRGWNSNEPDIIVIADSGYNGVVRVNGADMKLTETSTGSGIWIKQSAGSIKAMDDFLKHRNSTYYNSTSTNIKSVRFGKNINTASCTTLFAAFNCTNSTNTLFTKMDVRHLNTSSVTNFRATFADMAHSKKTIIGIEDLNVSSGTNFRYMFNYVYLGDVTIDLHKWHISSSADIFSMLGVLLQMSLYGGQNPKFYYTPGYWGKDPMNNSNLDSDKIKPTVYPYHDITIAGSSSFSGNILLNNEGASTEYTATMTRDNTLGIWYYDVPSNISISSLNRMLYRSNDSTVRDNVYSLSFAESIRSKLDYEPQVELYFGFFGMVHQCMAMRTVDIDALRGIKAGGANQMFISNLSGYTSKLCCIYGLEGIIAYYTGVEGNLSGGNYHFSSCSSLRYLKLGEWDMFNYLTQCFYGCSNLIRINRFPGVLSGCNTTKAMDSCTALTTIDSSGPISETLSFADCPLNVASAKVILSALQTVSGKTLTFSSTTKTAINGDSKALSLVTQARSKGWTISLS